MEMESPASRFALRYGANGGLSAGGQTPTGEGDDARQFVLARAGGDP
jgi:hypothetical protein